MSLPLRHAGRSLLLVFAGMLIVAGCDLFGTDDADEPQVETTGVFVANGGNFSDQNGTITVYDPDQQQAATPAALQLNAFVQSIALNDGRLFAQLNTGFSAGRVNILDADTYAATAQSGALGATRYVAFPASVDDAFVSTLRGRVHRFDPQTGALSESVAQVGASAAGLAAANGKIFAAVPDTSLALSDTLVNNGSKLAVYDIGSPDDVRTIDLGCDGPSAVSLDGEGELVVACTGQTTFSSNFAPLSRTPGAVVFVDPASESVVDRIPLDVQLGSATGGQVAHYDPVSETMHAASTRDRSIQRFDTDDNRKVGVIEVPSDPALSGIAATAYDGTSQRLYVARTDSANAFTSAGTALILTPGGEEVSRFTVGPAPSHIAIRRDSL